MFTGAVQTIWLPFPQALAPTADPLRAFDLLSPSTPMAGPRRTDRKLSFCGYESGTDTLDNLQSFARAGRFHTHSDGNAVNRQPAAAAVRLELPGQRLIRCLL